MASRVTNNMITDNAAYNIQLNKRYKDKLSKQQATERKVYDPSDDPVVAIRDLKYTAALADLDQYLNRNLADATSWVDMTETALRTAREVAENIKKEYTSSINGTNTVADRKIYLENKKALCDELYKIGNSASEDRYLFTGYRTGDSLTFTDHDMNIRAKTNGDGNPQYDYIIRETFDKGDVDAYSFLDNLVSSDNISNAKDGPINETGINSVDCYRIRLSYDNIADNAGQEIPAAAGVSSYVDKKGNTKLFALKTLNVTSGSTTTSIAVECKKDDTGITKADLDGGKVFLNTETGMLIFGENVKNQLYAADSVSIDYRKNEWNVGDLKPEHYFDCVDVALKEGQSGGSVLTYNDHEQQMNYAVGDSQTIPVNINANEAFDPQVKRQLDELEDAIKAVDDAEAKVEELKAKLEGGTYTEAERQNIEYVYNAAKKEQECCLARLNTVIEENTKEASANYDKVNLAATKSGTIQNRITLVSNRLTENITTVTAQASDNINIDLADIIIKLNEASITYSGSLGVIGKITQQTLLNYI
ncbi:MAG: hypothetical protein IJ815_02250 [Lachnospiraceae bacterium]|nr:hypothetical protein [Lachnospiraceae bacterium]